METKRDLFIIKTATTEEEVRQIYTFATSVIDNPQDTVHTLEYYLDHFHRTPGMIVYAINNPEQKEISAAPREDLQIIGSTLGTIEEDHVLVGWVAVAASARRLGIGQAMMWRLEEEAKKLGQTTLILGALQEAEVFYLACGFRPNLFIQLPESGRLEDLKRLNTSYPIAWEAEADGWTRLMLSAPQIDRRLQETYQRQFPACFTQVVFIKELAVENG